MVDYSRTKESKRFTDRVTSLVPRVFAPPGTFKPTVQQAREGHESFLNPLYMKALIDWHAAKKMQPAVEKYDNFEAPGYSPDLEPFWDEILKERFRKLKEQFHQKEKRNK